MPVDVLPKVPPAVLPNVDPVWPKVGRAEDAAGAPKVDPNAGGLLVVVPAPKGWVPVVAPPNVLPPRPPPLSPKVFVAAGAPKAAPVPVVVGLPKDNDVLGTPKDVEVPALVPNVVVPPPNIAAKLRSLGLVLET